MTLLGLFWIFVYVGTFTIGGGLVAITLMQEQIVDTGLVSADVFYNMVAISESTPGPIGINMATYVGYEMFGLWGGVVTTLGTVLPSLIVIILIAKYFGRIQDKPLVKSAFYGLRAGSTGMIAVAAWEVLNIAVLRFPAFFQTRRLQDLASWPALGLFAAMLLINRKFDWHPFIFIGVGAVFGVLFL